TVDFGLVLTRDNQRNRVVEAVVRSAVERVILLSGKREIDEEGFACVGTRRVDACAQNPIDARVEKNRRRKLRGLFCLAIEPEAWRDRLSRHHRLSFIILSVIRRRVWLLFSHPPGCRGRPMGRRWCERLTKPLD